MVATLMTYGLLLAAGVVLARGYRALRGSTLLGPWGWTCAALATLLLVHLARHWGLIIATDLDAWRFIAASATLGPGIALIGAKRPQDRAWQWIVASLWLVMALPALQHLVLRKTGDLDIHAARSWFLAGLVIFCAVNSLFSRYWPAVVVAAAGQLALLGRFLPIEVVQPGSWSWSLGVWGISFSVITAAAIPRRPTAQFRLDQQWLDFRDGWGLVWSLRMLEQVNVTARRNGWKVVLLWSGFQTTDGSPLTDLPPEQIRVLEQSVNNLLRRFLPARPGVCEES
jgi:hypothetical protein